MTIIESIKNGAKEQLLTIATWLGRISIITVPVVALFLISLLINKDASCGFMGDLFPFLTAASISVGFVLMIGNPFLAILVGILSGLILDNPLIKNLLCN